MKKEKLLMASLAGLLAVSISAKAVYAAGEKPVDTSKPTSTTDKSGCNGKDGCSGKNSCKSADKAANGGKDGCNSKDGCSGKSSCKSAEKISTTPAKTAATVEKK